MMNNRRPFSRRVAIVLQMVLVLVAASGVAAGAPAPLTAESVLDAELTVPMGRMRLSALSALARKQLGVDIACRVQAAEVFVRLAPGKYKMRDVQAAILASAPLTSQVMTVRERVTLCFWQKPNAPALAELMKLAGSEDVQERCTAARWLESVAGRDALARLFKMLADPDMRVRHFAARSIVDGWTSFSLRTVGTPSLVACAAPKGTDAVLTGIIRNETWRETIWNTLRIVRCLRDPRMLPALRDELVLPAGRDGRASDLVCAALADIGGAEAEVILLGVADRRPARVPHGVTLAVGALGTDRAVAWLKKRIDLEILTERPNFFYLARALAASDNPAAARELIRIMTRPGIGVQEVEGTTVRCLRQFDTPEAQALCLEVVKGRTDPVRQRGLTRALLGVAAVREHFFNELAKGGAARRNAAMTLVWTYDPRLVPALVEIIATNDRNLEADRWTAILTLGYIGGAEAEKVLRAVVRDNVRLRDKAQSALDNMSPPRARATSDLCADAATGCALSAYKLVSSRDARCIMAVRDVFRGDDSKLRRMLMPAFEMRRPAPLSAYYAVDAILAEPPAVDEKTKLQRARTLAWSRDPRGTAVLGKLLVDANEPQAVRLAVAEGLGIFKEVAYSVDPAAVEPLRHALEHDADERVRGVARSLLKACEALPAPPEPDEHIPEGPPEEREFPPPPDP